MLFGLWTTNTLLLYQLVTLTVNSGTELFWRLGVSGDSEDATGSALRLHNVRVVVEEAAKLTVGMAVEEAEAGSIRGDQGGIPLATLTLEGAAQQVRLFYRTHLLSSISSTSLCYPLWRWDIQAQTHAFVLRPAIDRWPFPRPASPVHAYIHAHLPASTVWAKAHVSHARA